MVFNKILNKLSAKEFESKKYLIHFVPQKKQNPVPEVDSQSTGQGLI